MPRVSPVEYSGQTVTLSVRLEILPNFVGLEAYESGNLFTILDFYFQSRDSNNTEKLN